MGSYQFIKIFAACSAVLSCLGLNACAGGNATSMNTNDPTTSVVEERSPKAQVARQDKTTTTTPQAQLDRGAKRAGASEQARAARPKKADQAKPTAESPKRQPQDPIYVSLAPPILDEKMQQAETPKGAVTEQIRSEFKADPVIILVKSRRSESTSEHPVILPSIADVEVSPKVSIKEVVEMNRKTGKPDKTMAVVYEATITSQVPPATYTVSESGHVLKKLEVSKRFAQQLRHVIVEKIGPRIPAH